MTAQSSWTSDAAVRLLRHVRVHCARSHDGVASVGNDVRKAIADGYPMQSCIASDLEPGECQLMPAPPQTRPHPRTQDFWTLGHRLFNSTPESFPVPFVPGDAFDEGFLKHVPPFYEDPETSVPPLSALTALTPLLGHVSAIHASSLFHLFDEERQFQLARSLAGLLSPQPGSFIFGQHFGRPEKGFRVEQGALGQTGSYMFCHSPESWKELWDGGIFKKGCVVVDVELKETHRRDLVPGSKFYHLVWSVTRL